MEKLATRWPYTDSFTNLTVSFGFLKSKLIEIDLTRTVSPTSLFLLVFWSRSWLKLTLHGQFHQPHCFFWFFEVEVDWNWPYTDSFTDLTVSFGFLKSKLIEIDLTRTVSPTSLFLLVFWSRSWLNGIEVFCLSKLIWHYKNVFPQGPSGTFLSSSSPVLTSLYRRQFFKTKPQLFPPRKVSGPGCRLRCYWHSVFSRVGVCRQDVTRKRAGPAEATDPVINCIRLPWARLTHLVRRCLWRKLLAFLRSPSPDKKTDSLNWERKVCRGCLCWLRSFLRRRVGKGWNNRPRLMRHSLPGNGPPHLPSGLCVHVDDAYIRNWKYIISLA